MWVRVPRLPRRGHGPTGRRWLRKPEIRVRLSVTPLEQHSPVVQRQRHLVHTQETMVRLHPGLPGCPGTPIGRAAWLGHRRAAVVAGGCRFDSGPGHGPVGNLADHLGLEPPDAVGPSPTWAITTALSSWSSLECSPGESRRRSRVQIPSRALSTTAARYANRQSGQAQTLVICGFDSRLRHSRTTCDDWALASPTGRNPAIP